MCISRTEGNAETAYYYQNGTLLMSEDGSGNLTDFYYLGIAGNPLALMSKASDGTKAYYTYQKDVQGSTRAVTNNSGSCVEWYTYTDFGETTVHEELSGFDNVICYTGGVYDENTGLYYLNARYYDPETGRFLGRDTYRGESGQPETLHLYLYCANDPVNYVDPSGHWAIGLSFIIEAVAAIGASVALAKKVYKILTSTKFKDAVKKLTNSVKSIASGRITDIHIALARGLAKAVLNVKNHKSKYEKHHIVAQTASKAEPARDILKALLKKGVQNEANLVYLKYSFHRNIHSSIYYTSVNAIIVTAFQSGKNKKARKNNVLADLYALKGMLTICSMPVLKLKIEERFQEKD